MATRVDEMLPVPPQWGSVRYAELSWTKQGRRSGANLRQLPAFRGRPHTRTLLQISKTRSARFSGTVWTRARPV
jgi:hypothetical protein